jgi:hypothetical protein
MNYILSLFGIQQHHDIQTSECSAHFSNLLDRVLICDVLFAYCSPATLFRVSRTCRLGRQAIQDYFARAYDINDLFSKFFQDVPAFRRLQARTEAVVSGSLALQFLDRTRYAEADCDLYVHSKHARWIGEWIMANNGAGKTYQFVSSERQPSAFNDAVDEMRARWIGFDSHRGRDTNLEGDEHTYVSDHVTGVFTFVSGDNGAIVQMIATNSNPVDAIMHFHSSKLC